MSQQAARPVDDPADAIADTPGGCVIQIKVIPRAPQTMIDGMRDGALLVSSFVATMVRRLRKELR